MSNLVPEISGKCGKDSEMNFKGGNSARVLIFFFGNRTLWCCLLVDCGSLKIGWHF